MIAISRIFAHIEPKVSLIRSAYNILSVLKSSATSITKRLDLKNKLIKYFKQLKLIGINSIIDHNKPT